MFSAVNLNSAYKQLSLFKYKLSFNKNAVITLSGSSILHVKA